MSAVALQDGRAAPLIAAVAVGVLLLTSALFAVVGVLRGADGVTSAAGPLAPVEDVDGASTGGDDDGEPIVGGAVGPTDSDGQPGAGDDSGVGPAVGPTDAAAEIPPGDVSVQVLDAVGDGGTAAATVADGLRADGFDVIVVNSASRQYEATTVYWSAGQGPGGRAVAASVGAEEASRTPDDVRLSDSVDVHVVVGADRVG